MYVNFHGSILYAEKERCLLGRGKFIRTEILANSSAILNRTLLSSQIRRRFFSGSPSRGGHPLWLSSEIKDAGMVFGNGIVFGNKYCRFDEVRNNRHLLGRLNGTDLCVISNWLQQRRVGFTLEAALCWIGRGYRAFRER